MPELDPFERSLETALRAFADRGVIPVDAVEFTARVAGRPRGMLSPWRPAPRPAWVLLLGAALLVALVGGALLVGSQQRKLPAVVPPVGQVYECPPGSTPDEPGAVDQARPTGLTIGASSLTLDRRAGKLVAITQDLETWTFDVCTNTWARMHPNQEPPRGTYGLVYDVDSDMTIASDPTARTWVYDLKANTWTRKGDEPPLAGPFYIRFYDPVSGHVVAAGEDSDISTLGLTLWSYDVETDTWTPASRAEPPVVGEHAVLFAYDASVDRLVAYAKPRGSEAITWLFDLRTGTWSEMGAVTPEFRFGIWGVGPSIAYDEATERTVMLGQGHSAAYDATADRWETRYGWSTSEDWRVACGTRPECRESPSMVYDPVNERLIVEGAVAVDDPDDLLAFDARTGEWTVLLPPSGGQPTPSSK